jgi:hypothetical protein
MRIFKGELKEMKDDSAKDAEKNTDKGTEEK